MNWNKGRQKFRARACYFHFFPKYRCLPQKYDAAKGDRDKGGDTATHSSPVARIPPYIFHLASSKAKNSKAQRGYFLRHPARRRHTRTLFLLSFPRLYTLAQRELPYTKYEIQHFLGENVKLKNMKMSIPARDFQSSRENREIVVSC